MLMASKRRDWRDAGSLINADLNFLSFGVWERVGLICDHALDWPVTCSVLNLAVGGWTRAPGGPDTWPPVLQRLVGLSVLEPTCALAERVVLARGLVVFQIHRLSRYQPCSTDFTTIKVSIS